MDSKSVLLLGTLAMAAAACPRSRAPAPETSAEAQPEAPPEPVSKYSGKARDFTEHLVSAPIRSYVLDVAGDARLTYDEMTFDRDNRWRAKASMALADEPYSCVESGTWEVDADSVEGRDSGRIDLSLETSDCPGRQPPQAWRIEVRYQGDDAEVVSR